MDLVLSLLEGVREKRIVVGPEKLNLVINYQLNGVAVEDVIDPRLKWFSHVIESILLLLDDEDLGVQVQALADSCWIDSPQFFGVV